MNVSGIYLISCQLENLVYVGSSINIKERFRRHRAELRKGKHHCLKLQVAWNTFDENVFKFEPLLICETKDLILYEQLVINFYGKEKLYNTSFSAESPMRDSEICKKVSISMTQSWTNPVVRNKMINALKEANGNPEKRSRMSQLFKLTHRRPETQAKLSAIRSTPVQCVETGQVFISAMAAGQWCFDQGLTKSASPNSYINKAVNGRWPTAYGFHWKSI